MWAYAHNYSRRPHLPRPFCCKHVHQLPGIRIFKPQGVRLSRLAEINLSVEEMEALRLAHGEQLYQEEAARRMAISRQTFGRLLDTAHQKVTRALSDGLALRIEGGSYHVQGDHPACPRCRGRHHPILNPQEAP